MKRRKAQYSSEQRQQLSTDIILQLMALPQWLEAKTVLLYHSLPDEVCTHALIDSALQQHKRVLLPVVVGEELELHQYTDHGALKEGAFHILEPQGPTFTDYAAIDLAVIPGVAFTTDGKRLGRGKGYYDRLLTTLNALPHPTPTFGLAWPCQMLTQIPTEPHDIDVQQVITATPEPSLLARWWYHTYKRYIALINNHLALRHRYTFGAENLPGENDSYIIVANHQNTANDPLNIIFGLPLHWHIHALARANVFSVHPLITRFLRWIGLIPAYRIGWEGGGGLQHNFQTFDAVTYHLNNAEPVIIFPEAGHTQGHYLDPFTTGAVRMAFHAAGRQGFQRDIKIVPTAHHYSDYFDMRADFLWMVGKPISLQPYYAQFQQHPNSVMRDITRQLRATIQDMMLDEGKEDYAAKDFLRRSAINPATLQAMPLPDRLQADKQFVQRIISHPRRDDILAEANALRQMLNDIGIDDTTVALARHPLRVGLCSLILLLLLPLWIVCLWPHVLCYTLPTLLLHTDKMFTNSYRVILSIVVLYPLFAVLTFATLTLAWGAWWQALLWTALWVPTGQFAWTYFTHLRQTIRDVRRLMHPDAVARIRQARHHLTSLITLP